MKKYKLNLNRLKEHEGFYDYYNKEFKFYSLTIENISVPIYKDVIKIAVDTSIELCNIYVNSFIEEYQRLSNIDISTPEAKNLATHPMGEHWINKYNLELLKLGRSETWELCAEHTARVFKAWEVVINNLTYFDKAVMKKPDSNDFINYLIHPNKDELIKKLHDLIDNTKTKHIITVLKALQKKGYIIIGDSNAKLYNAMRKEFKIQITDSGANGFYFNDSKIMETEIENIERMI